MPMAFKYANAIGADTPHVPCTKPPITPKTETNLSARFWDILVEFFVTENAT